MSNLDSETLKQILYLKIKQALKSRIGDFNDHESRLLIHKELEKVLVKFTKEYPKESK